MKTDCHKTKHPTPYTLHPTLHNTTLHSLHPTPSITDHKQAMIHQGERLTLTPTPFTLEDDHALVAMQDVHAAGQGARLSHLGGPCCPRERRRRCESHARPEVCHCNSRGNNCLQCQHCCLVMTFLLVLPGPTTGAAAQSLATTPLRRREKRWRRELVGAGGAHPLQ